MVFELENRMMDIGGHKRMNGHDQPSRSGRAAKLQYRWLEVSERERQAHIFNRQLLQDFHRAQDTINDLMVRTAAMNTLRVEYERHLEQLYPQWQQKLQEQKLSTQRKRLEMHLREFMTQVDGESPEAISSNSPNYSFPSSSPSNRRQEGPNQRPRNTHVAEKFNKPKTLIKQSNSDLNGFPQLPPTWLTQVNQPILRPDPMVAEPRGAHGIPPPPLNPPPRGDVYNSYSPVYQEPPIQEDDLRENSPYPLSWARVGEGPSMPQTQPNPYGSWPPAGLPMLNPAVWRMVSSPVPGGEDVHSSLSAGGGSSRGGGRGGGSGGEGRGGGGGGGDRGPMGSQTPRSPGRGPSRHGHRMGVNEGTSDRTCELDTKPVRLLGAEDESSAASSTSKRSKTKRKEGKGSQRSVVLEREDTISQQSAAVSQASLVPNLRRDVFSRNTNIEESSSESAEQTHSVSRRSQSTNGTQNGLMKVPMKASRENVSVTSSKQSGKSAIASVKTQASLVPNFRQEVFSRNTNIEESSSESAEQTHSVSRRSKSTKGTQNGLMKVPIKASRENISVTSSKQSGKSAIASIKTQDRPQEPTDDETEENAPSVRSDIATGGEDEEDERLETDDDEEDIEEQENKGMVGERVEKGKGAEQEQSEEEEDDEEEEEEEKDEAVEVFGSHSGQLRASREVGSDKALSNGSQKSQNGNSKKNGTKEIIKEVDKNQSKDKPTEEEDEDNEDQDSEDEDDDDEDEDEEDELEKEEEEDEEEEEEDDDDEGDSEEEPQQPKLVITKDQSISNRNNPVNQDNENEDEDNEEEEMYNQEIEDDEEDEVVVDNGYVRTEGQKYNFLKFLDEKDEDDDDIEGVLAPKVEVPKPKEMIPKVIVVQKGSESDSDEEVPEKKKNNPMVPGDKAIDSDDEFDHFYD